MVVQQVADRGGPREEKVSSRILIDETVLPDMRAAAIEAVDSIESRAQEYLAELARLPDEHPGRSVAKRYDHMVRMFDGVRESQSDLLATSSDIVLAQVVSFAHDIGRFEEALRYGQKRTQDHGDWSEQILRGAGSLSSFSPEDQGAMYIAIREHSKSSVTSEVGTLAWRLSYTLRNADKFDILADTNHYLHAPGICSDFNRHFVLHWISNWNEATQWDSFGDHAEAFIRAALDKRPSIGTRFPPAELNEPLTLSQQNWKTELEPILLRYLNGGLTEAGFQQFRNGVQMEQTFKGTHAEYMLIHLAMLSDVKGETGKALFRNHPGASARIAFLDGRISSEQLKCVKEMFPT